MTAPPLVAVAHGSRDPAAAEATRSLLAAVRRAAPGPDRARGLPRPRVAAAERPGATHASTDPSSWCRCCSARRTTAGSTSRPPSRRPGPGGAGRRCWGRTRCCCAALERRLAEAGVRAGRPGHRGRARRRRVGGRVVDRGGARARRRRGATRGWWAVSAAFASAAEPSVEEAVADLRAAGAPRVAVATYLLFPGLFADKLAAAGADVDRPRRSPTHPRSSRSSSPATTPPPAPLSQPATPPPSAHHPPP